MYSSCTYTTIKEHILSEFYAYHQACILGPHATVLRLYIFWTPESELLPTIKTKIAVLWHLLGRLTAYVP